ncbi:hypothetical protein TW65_04371 [Stemphylium lycopersici]|uniref:F-box domain-containing protein n=1 Tax=Stemphylium lycopersici TaxID=183478 RepID=A0A364N9V0_STELY|nr:hypothetical protein TW65_04371 [Stemphylium lycopersici]RAR14020.1 hypothetical protein DDE83_002589 [Stemphylium lycopersici]
MVIINQHDFPLLPSQEARRQLVIARGAAGRASSSSRRASRATLNDLPDELILEILGYLPGINLDQFQLPTLLNLAFTSRRLYRVVIDKAYAQFDSHFCEPYLFLRTLISNSQLAELVNEVKIIFGQWTLRKDARHAPTAKDKKTIKEGLRSSDIPGWKDWATECNEEGGSDEAVHNAILLYTPNVTSIGVQDFTSTPSQHPAWVDVISKAALGAYGKTHRFEHLQSIKIHVRWSTLAQIAPLFRIQSLLILHLGGLLECNMDTYTGDSGDTKRRSEHALKLQRLIPHGCNNIEELSLEHTYYSKRFLEVLVSSSRNLKAFKYEVSLDHLAAWEIPPETNSMPMINVLESQKASLETLRVFCDAQAEEETHGEIHVRDGMTGFTSLKHLSCPLGMIMPECSETFAEKLPPSLLTYQTTIRQYTTDQKGIGALEHMIAYSQSHTPRLQEVQVVIPHSASWIKYNWEDLVQISGEVGLGFRLEEEEEDTSGFSNSWRGGSIGSSRSSDEVDLYSD